MSGMFASSRTSLYGSPAAQRPIQRIERGASALDRGRRHPPARNLLGQDAAVHLIVVDDEHFDRPQNGVWGRQLGISAMSSDTVKWNVLPIPGSLSTHTRPPINSTSVDEIVSPRPVPPKRRVVEPSAWRNASKMAWCCSGGNADAGVGDADVQRRRCSRFASPPGRRRTHDRAR